MEYRRLGKWGAKVSEISIGGWLTQGRTIDDNTTEAIIKRAFELGVNFFDTADIYNKGEAELSLGKAIVGLRREDLFIATKTFWPMTEAVNDRGLSRKHIVESVDASLKRMKLDYIDLYQFHRFDPETPVEESVRAIDDLIRAGKVLYWGVSEWEADQIADAIAAAEKYNCHFPVSDQPLYNMLDRKIEHRILPTCEKHGLGLVVFSPMAQGVLSGKYEPGKPLPTGSRAADSTSNGFMARYMTDDVLTRVQKLKVLAEKEGHSLNTFALAWCLRQKQLSSVIVGATTVEQVEANVKAAGVKCSPEIWTQAEEILHGPH